MTSNPIQKRARQSFIIGFLVALLIMAIVAGLLLYKINKTNQQLTALQESLTTVTIYVTNTAIKSGDEVNTEKLTPVTVTVGKDTASYLMTYYAQPGSFEETKEVEVESSDGETTTKETVAIKYYARGDIEEGSMIPTGMTYTEELKDSERLIEYNMIILPSQLQNGNSIDIRLRLADGRDYIVLSKKLVEQTTAESIWMTVDEEEILTMNSAIVESYCLKGAKLYATIYTDPGQQEAAEETYPQNTAVIELINIEPNILDDAKKALNEKWTTDRNGNGTNDYTESRNNINSYLTGDETSVEGGDNDEIEDLTSMREDYINKLEGTGLIGITY